MSGFEKLVDLDIHFNPEGWGPINGEKIAKFGNMPYLHFDKKDKIGRPADFVLNTLSSSQGYARTFRRRDDALGAEYVNKHEVNEDKTFQLVDTAKSQQKHKHAVKKQGNKAQNRLPRQSNPAFKKKGDKFIRKKQDRKMDRVPSLTVEPDWDLVEEFDLNQLLKLAANPPSVDDLAWCGFVDQYDDNYDKLSTRLPSKLRRFDKKIFYDATTFDDPIIEKFAVDNIGNVYATDDIIAQLMAAPRSVYSWDVVVQKLRGSIYLDKRAGSSIDYLTVSETAVETPNPNEDINSVNHPDKLATEATAINQNFSQQILLPGHLEENRKQFEPNPFYFDDQPGMEPASIAYRYRKFNLGSIRLVARTQVHGWQNKRGEVSYMNAYSLNEWDSRFCNGVNWRQKIDNQRGAVLATELKNNSAKIAKWTAQSLLSGVDQMKLGYVSRTVAANSDEHAILATQFFKPKDFAQQINLSIPNVWGILKMFCELLLKKEDGKYVIFKDPNKAVVRLYSVPLSAFEEDDDEDEEDDEEEEGEGEEEVEEEATTVPEVPTK